MSSIRSYFRRIAALVANQKGAALPEFAIAIFPLVLMFFTWCQVAEMFINHLVLHHAAVVAARCAIVDKGPNLPGKYVDSDADTACKNAAIAGVGRVLWYRSILGITVTMDYTGGNDHIKQYDDVTTTTTGEFQCNVPLGSKVVCGGSTKEFKFIIKLPHEGAMYTLDNDYNGS